MDNYFIHDVFKELNSLNDNYNKEEQDNICASNIINESYDLNENSIFDKIASGANTLYSKSQNRKADKAYNKGDFYGGLMARQNAISANTRSQKYKNKEKTGSATAAAKYTGQDTEADMREQENLEDAEKERDKHIDKFVEEFKTILSQKAYNKKQIESYFNFYIKNLEKSIGRYISSSDPEYIKLRQAADEVKSKKFGEKDTTENKEQTNNNNSSGTNLKKTDDKSWTENFIKNINITLSKRDLNQLSKLQTITDVKKFKKLLANIDFKDEHLNDFTDYLFKGVDLTDKDIENIKVAVTNRLEAINKKSNDKTQKSNPKPGEQTQDPNKQQKTEPEVNGQQQNATGTGQEGTGPNQGEQAEKKSEEEKTPSGGENGSNPSDQEENKPGGGEDTDQDSTEQPQETEENKPGGGEGTDQNSEEQPQENNQQENQSEENKSEEENRTEESNKDYTKAEQQFLTQANNPEKVEDILDAFDYLDSADELILESVGNKKFKKDELSKKYGEDFVTLLAGIKSKKINKQELINKILAGLNGKALNKWIEVCIKKSRDKYTLKKLYDNIINKWSKFKSNDTYSKQAVNAISSDSDNKLKILSKILFSHKKELNKSIKDISDKIKLKYNDVNSEDTDNLDDNIKEPEHVIDFIFNAIEEMADRDVITELVQELNKFYFNDTEKDFCKALENILTKTKDENLKNKLKKLKDDISKDYYVNHLSDEDSFKNKLKIKLNEIRRSKDKKIDIKEVYKEIKNLFVLSGNVKDIAVSEKLFRNYVFKLALDKNINSKNVNLDKLAEIFTRVNKDGSKDSDNIKEILNKYYSLNFTDRKKICDTFLANFDSKKALKWMNCIIRTTKWDEKSKEFLLKGLLNPKTIFNKFDFNSVANKAEEYPNKIELLEIATLLKDRKISNRFLTNLREIAKDPSTKFIVENVENPEQEEDYLVDNITGEIYESSLDVNNREELYYLYRYIKQIFGSDLNGISKLFDDIIYIYLSRGDNSWVKEANNLVRQYGVPVHKLFLNISQEVYSKYFLFKLYDIYKIDFRAKLALKKKRYRR